MRSVPAVTIVLAMLAAGVAGWVARGFRTATSPVDTPSPSGGPTPHSYPGPVEARVESAPRVDGGPTDARLADLARRVDALAVEVRALRREESAGWAGTASEREALRARIDAIAVTQEALAKKAGVPLPWPSDPTEVEKVRARWRSNLEESEKRLRALYPQGPDPRDVVGWSRFDDHQRAKTAFEAATDSASLRLLSEGEFRSVFTMTR